MLILVLTMLFTSSCVYCLCTRVKQRPVDLKEVVNEWRSGYLRVKATGLYGVAVGLLGLRSTFLTQWLFRNERKNFSFINQLIYQLYKQKDALHII